jgi:pyridinium-3,5-biscarboxylic acid mononucleotide sulfurtransferase
MNDKLEHLERAVAGLGRALVAYSGGVDSHFLLSVCVDRLGPADVLAVTVDSPLLPHAELVAAEEQAAALGAPHLVVRRDELADPAIANNPSDRCYHCKRGRFLALREIAAERDFAHLLHGENADDAGDYRPGVRAACELGVIAPLADAGLTKAEVRALSRERGLPTWDRPAQACLASRFPYGTPLTAEGLARVEMAERALVEQLGPVQVRVRDHWPVARLEVAPADIARLTAPDLREPVVARLLELGYLYVTVDLAGYRTGSLNDAIDLITL